MIFTSSWLADILIFSIFVFVFFHMRYQKLKNRFFLLDPLNAFWAGIFVCCIKEPMQSGQIFIGWHNMDIFNLTFFYVFFGIVFVVVGYESGLGKKIGRKLPYFPYRLNPGRFLLAGVFFTGLGVLSYYLQFQSAGGAAAWLAVGRGGTDYKNVSGYVTELETCLPFGIYLLLVHVNMHRVQKWTRILIVLLAAVGFIWFFYLGTRSRVILMSLLILSAYYLPKRKGPPFSLVLLMFLGLILVTNFQQYYRYSFTNLSFNMDQKDLAEVSSVILPDFLGGSSSQKRRIVSKGDDFNVIMSTIELVPDRVPYNYGYGFLEFFTNAIPRSIWPDKIYPGLEAVQGVLSEGGLSETRVGSTKMLAGPAFNFTAFWYYILGPVGLVLGGLWTGILFRVIRSLYDRNPGSEGDVIIYSLLLIIGFDESAATPFVWIYTIPLTLLPIVFLLKKCEQRAQSSLGNNGNVVG